MAWIGRVTRIIPEATQLRSLVEVKFYDNALTPNPTSGDFLHSATYSSDTLTSFADFQAAVVAEGQAARQAYNRAQAVKNQLPVGREITIP
jgi:hypothetical protein